MLFDDFYCLSIQRNKIGFFFQEDLYGKKKLQLVTATLSHIFLKTHSKFVVLTSQSRVYIL